MQRLWDMAPLEQVWQKFWKRAGRRLPAAPVRRSAHGMVSLVVAGVLNCTKEQVYSIVKNFGLDLLSLTDTALDIRAAISNITEV